MVKKILFFTGGSYVAGLEIVTLLLIKGLKEKGYDVRCVVTGWNDGDFKNRLSEMDVPYYEVMLGWLYLTKPQWTWGTIVNYPKAYRTCRSIIKEFKPDVFHFTSYAMPVMLYPLIGKNSVYTLHDTQLPNFKHLAIYKLLNNKIRTFVAVSNLIADTLEKMKIPLEKIRVIHNGVEEEGDFVKKKLDPGSVVNFAIVGQVAEWKGHELLISAADLLLRSGVSNFTITIVGNNNNPYSEKLVRLIEEKKLTSHFVWKGFMSKSSEIYKNIDVVVVPSMSTTSKYFVESFSLTTAEAMLRGLVVIASNKGGMKELIVHNETGVLFTEGDAAALCNCMDSLISNSNLVNLLGTNAHTTASANFTDKAMTDKYITLYKAESSVN